MQLVLQKSPAVQRVLKLGARVGFEVTQKDPLQNCTFNVRAFENKPTHITTLGFYTVDICNGFVYDAGLERNQIQSP